MPRRILLTYINNTFIAELQIKILWFWFSIDEAAYCEELEEFSNRVDCDVVKVRYK